MSGNRVTGRGVLCTSLSTGWGQHLFEYAIGVTGRLSTTTMSRALPYCSGTGAIMLHPRTGGVRNCPGQALDGASSMAVGKGSRSPVCSVPSLVRFPSLPVNERGCLGTADWLAGGGRRGCVFTSLTCKYFVYTCMCVCMRMRVRI